jgi:uncharacterized membrane protein YbhN (UPF0104 family)
MRVIVALATFVYLTWLLATNWDEFTRAVLRLSGASGPWLAAGVVIEVAAQVTGGLLLRRLLAGAGHRISKRRATQLSLAQNAVGFIVPGGPVAGGAFAFRYLRRRGLDPAATLWVLAGANTVSGIAVATLGIVAVTGLSAWSVISLVLLGALALYLANVVRHPALVRRPARAAYRALAWLRRRPVGSVDEHVELLIERLSAVRLSRRDWMIVATYAAITVVADCAALVCCTRALVRRPLRCAGVNIAPRVIRQCAAFRSPTFSRILLTYVAGQATLSLPFVPGGLGPVEAAMTFTFVAGHIRPVSALSAVLLYRLLSYWGVLLVGIVCWRRLRRHPIVTDPP